ncbi:MAG: hypothetical protein P9L97_01090 [Candidatus Tenebribacter davisii]|nr:hypothetical protein [Candidatus Tenebribacter davisii]
MNTRFFNNSGENTLLNKFKGIFENNKDIENFDALVGYFRKYRGMYNGSRES